MENSDKLKNIAFFNTKGGSKDKSFKEMEEICKKKPLSTLSVKVQEIKDNRFKNKLLDFVDALRI